MKTANEQFIEAFAAGDVAAAEALAPSLPAPSGFRAHPLLLDCVNANDGQCHTRRHLQIADLLLPSEVRRFRDSVIADEVEEVRAQLEAAPDIVAAEFTAGRGISQAIHHWRSVEVGELLLAGGADIDALTTVHDQGDTPLGMQVRAGNIENARFLLERGADPHLRPQMHMPSKTMCELIDLLISHGWDVQRGSQLMHDANHGHGARVVTWLKYGADANVQNDGGQSALHLFAMRGTGAEAIRALVKAGADINLRDHYGDRPIDLARGAVRQAAARELISLGARG
jgi:ankyrin repeat protein